MASHETYVCDADCLINLHRHFGRASIKALRAVSQKGGLKLPEGVVREILRGTDKLANFVKKERGDFVVTISSDQRLAVQLSRLEKLYGETIEFGKQRYEGFWKSRAGRQAADAQVVAAAKVLDGMCVSDDRAIKLACALEGAVCIGWSEFARRLGLIKSEQLGLGLDV